MKKKMLAIALVLALPFGVFSAYASPGEYDDYPVRHMESGNLYTTLGEAVTAIESGAIYTYTLEVTGDVTETSSVIIKSGSNVTIVGAEGSHTVDFSPDKPSLRFAVEGGTLTLGEGTDTNPLTILHFIDVTDGAIHVKEGAIIKDSAIALQLKGPNTSGTISGGRIEGGYTALNLKGKAKLSEISGGVFAGKREAVHMTDAGTMIERISGGEFYQTDPAAALHGQAVFVQDEAKIGEISGGHFEAARSSALIIIRGARVDEISGGEFTALNTYDIDGHRNAVVRIDSDWSYKPNASIGIISGGSFTGGHFGILCITGSSDTGSEIGKISGGIFEATVALQNDANCVINEITGGTFLAKQGMFNAGKIGKIGGQAEFLGKTSNGIYNFAIGVIDEINGGKIVSEGSHGIANAGKIRLISGGTIIGRYSAINCDGNDKGALETITGGVFWGNYDAAILLAAKYPLTLEPGLSAAAGSGRYWGAAGVIFNNESLVIYPVNEKAGLTYEMSESTLPAAGVAGTEFKYLMIDLPENVTTEPEKPEEPQKPEEPEQPEGPEKPVDPKKPEEPEKPEEPVNSDEPGSPGKESYIEYDENGVPLGEWHWDDELGEWVFEPHTRLSDAPQTGGGLPFAYFLLLGGSLAGMIVARRDV